MLLKADIRLQDGYPTHEIRVQLKWPDGRPPGEVTVMAKADDGENPAAEKLSEGLYQFTLLESAHYTISAWEDLDPQRASARRGAKDCIAPPRIDAEPVVVNASDADTKEITLTFANPGCTKQTE